VRRGEGDTRRKDPGERGERPVGAPFPVGWIEEGGGGAHSGRTVGPGRDGHARGLGRHDAGRAKVKQTQ
jgi:hypothetical protein